MPKTEKKTSKSKEKSVDKSKKGAATDKTSKKGKSDSVSKSSKKSTGSKKDIKATSKTGEPKPAEAQPIAQIMRYCVAHKLKLEFYCESCEEPICSLCTTLGPHNNQV